MTTRTMTLPTSLISTLTAASPNFAGVANNRASPEAGSDAFARQLDQLRQARVSTPLSQRMPSAATLSSLQASRAPSPAAVLPHTPAGTPPDRPAATKEHSAPHRNESRAPAPARERRAESQRSKSPDNDAPVAEAPPDTGDDPTAKTDTATGADAAASNPAMANAAPPEQIEDATAHELTALGLPGQAAGDSTATLAATDAVDDLRSGRSGRTGRGTDVRGTDLAATGQLPGARAGQAAGTATGTPSWQQMQAQANAGQAATEAATGKLAEEAIETRATELSAPLAHLPVGGVAGPATPQGLAGTARPADAAQVNLATPTTSPEFRAALGAQVSVLARDGVQEARLHLNPADMGPVTVQIVLEGRQAQIHFGADSAQTRQLIESGMPELASALRDAGLTLSGGGVSQHGSGNRGDASSTPGGRSIDGRQDTDGADGVTSVTPRSRPAVVRAGGLDLYA
jgi:flagellar hook-length control protein FliK